MTKDPPREGWTLDMTGAGGDYSNVLANATPAVGWDDYGASVTYQYDQISGFSLPADRRGRAVIPFSEDSNRDSHDLYGTFRWNPVPAFTTRTRFEGCGAAA